MENETKSNRGPQPVYPDRKVKKPWQAWLGGSPVLIISVLIHILFLALALFFVVQRIHEKRKQNFTEVSVTAPTQKVEQKIQLTKMQQAQSSPEMTQRIVTKDISSINLPAVNFPSENPGEGSAKMGAAAIGGIGDKTGMGGGGTPINVDVSVLASAFGIENGEGLGLLGKFYDFKQTSNKMPIAMTTRSYDKAMSDYVNGGWNESSLNKYFKVAKTLYLLQCLIPVINANVGPESFGVGGLVSPDFTGVHYRGAVSPPESGRYRFVGFGDNILAVRFNHRTVLESGLDSITTMKPTAQYPYTFLTDKSESPEFAKHGGLWAGEWFDVDEGDVYPIDIIIGESGGSKSCYFLLIEKEGASYEKTPEGSPLLPIFRFTKVTDNAPSNTVPPHQKDGPLWHLIAEDENAEQN